MCKVCIYTIAYLLFTKKLVSVKSIRLFQDIAENIYTVPEVIAESCDRATRRRLKTFPLDIKFKEPSGDSVLLSN